MRTMAARLFLVALLSCGFLTGCVEQYPQGYGYAPPPPQYPHYTRSPRSYDSVYSDRQAYEERRRRVMVNCNMGWTNCSNNCNLIQNPQQRAVCVANCNNARNQCIRNF